jgi:colicin import membrane protein
MPGVSRVFVRTSTPPRFTIQDVGENLIRVELENTRVVRRNDARFLDTSFFPSAVALITPSRHGSSYVVDIKLKQKVPYQQKIEGDMLAIDFERPAAASGAELPADAGADAGPGGAAAPQ